MTYKAIKQLIQGFGLPYTYNSFPNNIAPTPPYIVFNYPNNDDFGADNENYVSIDVLNIELYTQNKDFELEEAIEAALKENGFYYEKSEAYIRSENLYQISYVSEVITEQGVENG